jgi:PPK2 family polyphosphate:nucleotide phosphotransferase
MKELKNISTKPPKQASKSKCKAELTAFHKQLFELQNVFYADGRYGLLIILQGMDTSGKDGTVRHVMTCMNPMGLRVQSFKKPTEEELKHDFLWRLYPHIPEKGMIQVFNRSYYEDIIVPTINGTLTEEIYKHRCFFINALEQHLLQNDIHVLKFFLHISKQEQEERIEERLLEPHKRWKYSKEDVKASNKFDSYTEIYNNIIEKCRGIPWHVIPSDKRWYRNYKVAEIVLNHMQSLKLMYPTISEN